MPNTRHRNTNVEDERVEIWKPKGIKVAQMEEDGRHVQEVQKSGSWGNITDRQAKSLWMYSGDRQIDRQTYIHTEDADERKRQGQ